MNGNSIDIPYTPGIFRDPAVRDSELSLTANHISNYLYSTPDEVLRPLASVLSKRDGRILSWIITIIQLRNQNRRQEVQPYLRGVVTTVMQEPRDRIIAFDLTTVGVNLEAWADDNLQRLRAFTEDRYAISHAALTRLLAVRQQARLQRTMPNQAQTFCTSLIIVIDMAQGEERNNEDDEDDEDDNGTDDEDDQDDDDDEDDED